MHTWNPSTQKAETGGSVPDHSWLHGEFRANLGYMNSCLKGKKRTTKPKEIRRPLPPVMAYAKSNTGDSTGSLQVILRDRKIISREQEVPALTYMEHS